MSFLLSILVIFVGLLGLTPNAQALESRTTIVNIHKVGLSDFQGTPLPNENGEIVDIDQLGGNANLLPGVTFSAYPISQEDFEDWSENTQNIPSQPTGSPAWTGTTGESGSVTWSHTLPENQNGQYYAVYETASPENVSDSIAVPFVIAFPMTATDGSQLTEVNIYPKNIVGNFPTVDKDVAQLNNESRSYTVGEEVTYFLKSSIPENIQSYDQFIFTDQLSPFLAFNGASVSVGGEELTANTDYTVSNDGGNVIVSLTAAGINKIAAQVPVENRNFGASEGTTIENVTANTSATPFIEVRLSTTLQGSDGNTSVPLGTNIENDFSLNYSTTPDTEGTTISSNAVSIQTGGKTFQKVTAADQTPLAGAIFELHVDGAPVEWTEELIEANQTAIDGGRFVTPTVGSNVQLTSPADGNFEIRGLGYSEGHGDDNVTSAYTLVETQAPEGYSILANPVDFTVDADSHNNVLQIENNRRAIIPATGGIGSVIFILIGLILMAFAGYGYKRYTAE